MGFGGRSLTATGPLAVAVDSNESGCKAGNSPPSAGTRVGHEVSSCLMSKGPLCHELAAFLEGGLCVRIRNPEGGLSRGEVRASGSSIGCLWRRLGRDVTVLSVRLGGSRRGPCSVELPEQLGFPFGSPTALLEHSGFEGAVAGAGSSGGSRTARGAAAGIIRLGPVRGLDTTPRNLAWFVIGFEREKWQEWTIGMILTI